MGLKQKTIKIVKLTKKGISFLGYHGIKETYAVTKNYFAKRRTYQVANDSSQPIRGDIKFSILMPVYNVDPQWLSAAICSIEKQNYVNWELCIVDDCSTDEKVKEYLKSIHNPKIKIYFSEENGGISVATNKAAEMATGSYYLLMDNDDEIASNALSKFYCCIKETGAKIIYSDQDIIDINGNHREPLYKPDWSPDLFLSQMYLGHLLGFASELFEKVGGFRSEYNGSQDYDLLLRMTLETDEIRHIPEVLYSWRDIPTSTAANPESKPYAQTAGLNAIQSFLDKKYGKQKAVVKETDSLFVYDVRYPIPENTRVAVIIPTKDHVDLLKTAIDSIEKETNYSNYNILILNNNSTEKETFSYFETVVSEYDNIRVEDAKVEFNWSKINNIGLDLIDADVYIFLNNDIKIIDEDWMTRLAENAVRPEVGVVGPLLLYEDDTIQHAGVVVGMGGWAEHVYKGEKPVHYGSPFVSPMVTRNVTAVTGACMAVSKKTLKDIGRFDERFIICGSDIELGIRARNRGLYNVYIPNTKLYHFESKSRDSYIPEIDFKLSYDLYSTYREKGDPFYNNNLDYYKYTPAVLNKEAPVAETVVETPAQNEYITANAVKVDEINPYYFRTSNRVNKRLNLFVPSINPEHVFGGISTAIKFFVQLADELGYDQRIILVDAEPSKEALDNYSAYELVAPNKDSESHKQIVSYPYRDTCGIPVAENDYFMFTGWWTAHCAQEAFEEYKKEYGITPKPFLYFIQDYEPGFYAWSTRYLLADATYKYNHPTIAVFNSSELKTFFDNNGYHFAHSFVFDPVFNAGLKRELKRFGTTVRKKKQILIYGRPSTERNAFTLIVAALNKWTSIYENAREWEIISAGEKHPDIMLNSECMIHSVGKLSIEGYAQLLADSAVGISLMVSPHPSYPPLEMATYGVKVITNNYANKDLSSFHPNIVSLECASTGIIASTLSQLCDDYTMDVSLEYQNKAYVSDKQAFDFLKQIKDIYDQES